MASEPLRHETYTHGHAPATVRQHARRTAEEAAAFLLPDLRPGLRLLDVGCGPGSITRGLAKRVAPGEAIGLDLSRETLAAAREDAAARGLDNLRYEEGSVYELPFAEASFQEIAADGRRLLLWLGDRDRHGMTELAKLLPREQPFVALPLLPGEPTDVAVDERHLWVATLGGLVRFRLDAVQP